MYKCINSKGLNDSTLHTALRDLATLLHHVGHLWYCRKTYQTSWKL